MNELVNFLKDYWQYISIALVIIFDLIILIVKRRPKTVDDFMMAVNETLAIVPHLVKSVECEGNGASKKQEVIKCFIDVVECHLGRKLTDREVQIVNPYVSNQIEAVLEAPTKKEVN